MTNTHFIVPRSNFTLFVVKHKNKGRKNKDSRCEIVGGSNIGLKMRED